MAFFGGFPAIARAGLSANRGGPVIPARCAPIAAGASNRRPGRTAGCGIIAALPNPGDGNDPAVPAPGSKTVAGPAIALATTILG